MITTDFFKTMALYNKWQNESLFARCDDLSKEQLHLTRDMFFDSIFKTLNHILYVDETLYRLIHTKQLSDFDPKRIPYAHYDELKTHRFKFDEKLIHESESYTQAWLNEIFELWSDRLNRNRRIPRAFYYVQMFNHQTHHRSQITAELHKMGIDYGCTDLPYNPYCNF